MSMYRLHQFQLTVGDVVAIQRDGTLQRDLDIAEWMERSHPHGEYRCSAEAFVVSTSTVDLPAGTDDWIVGFADGRFIPCPDRLFSAITRAVPEAPLPSPCSECCDPVPPAGLPSRRLGVPGCALTIQRAPALAPDHGKAAIQKVFTVPGNACDFVAGPCRGSG